MDETTELSVPAGDYTVVYRRSGAAVHYYVGEYGSVTVRDGSPFGTPLEDEVEREVALLNIITGVR